MPVPPHSSVRVRLVRDALLVRALGGEDKDAESLRARGVSVVEDPYLVVATCADEGAARRAAAVLEAIEADSDWLVVTSRAALRALTDLAGEDRVRAAIRSGSDRGMGFATVGDTTRTALEQLGASDVLVPAVSTAEALRGELAGRPAGSIVAPQGSQAMKGLASGLRSLGWRVDEQVVYETTTVAARPPTADRLSSGGFGVVVLRSPTAVRAVTGFAGTLPEQTAAVCGGPTTAAAARAAGIGTVVVSPGPTAAAVADTVLEYLSRPGA